MFFKLNNFYKVMFIIFTMIGYSMTIEANDNIFSYEIKNISQSILMKKKEPDYPGMSLAETILNMKILEEWLND